MISPENIAQAQKTYEQNPTTANYQILKQLTEKYNERVTEQNKIALKENIESLPPEIRNDAIKLSKYVKTLDDLNAGTITQEKAQQKVDEIIGIEGKRAYIERTKDQWIKDKKAEGLEVFLERNEELGIDVPVAYTKEQLMWKYALAQAKGIIEAADRGEPVRKVEEGLYSIFTGAWATNLWDIATGKGSKQERIERLARSLYEWKERKSAEGLVGVAKGITMTMPAVIGATAVGARIGGYALGYAKSVSPTIGGAISKGVGRASLVYTAKETIEEAPKAYAEGKIGPYIIKSVVPATVGFIGGYGGYKAGSISGYRKRMLSFATTPTEKARLQDLFKAIDTSTRMKTGTKGVFALENIKNLTPENQAKLTKFLNSPEGRKFKIIQGGSSAQETFMLNQRQPHDIDFLIKPRRFAGMRARLSRLGVKEASRITEFKAALQEAGLDPELFDIHDYVKPGTPFTQIGTGYTQKAVRTQKGDIFKYRMGIQEQAGRKWASATAPVHEYRGKDWIDAMRISAEKWKATPQNKALYSRLQKWQPQVSETGKFTGPSYFEKYPQLAPKTKFTLFEKGIRRWGTPLTDLSSSKEFPITEAGKTWGPKLETPYRYPDWAKGVKFFSIAGVSPALGPEKYPVLTYSGIGAISSRYPYGKQPKRPTKPIQKYPIQKTKKRVYITSTDKYPKLTTPSQKYPTYPPQKSYPPYPPPGKKQTYPPYYPTPGYPYTPPTKKKRYYYGDDEDKKKKRSIKPFKIKPIKYRERTFNIPKFTLKSSQKQPTSSKTLSSNTNTLKLKKIKFKTI